MIVWQPSQRALHTSCHLLQLSSSLQANQMNWTSEGQQCCKVLWGYGQRKVKSVQDLFNSIVRLISTHLWPGPPYAEQNNPKCRRVGSVHPSSQLIQRNRTEFTFRSLTAERGNAPAVKAVRRLGREQIVVAFLFCSLRPAGSVSVEVISWSRGATETASYLRLTSLTVTALISVLFDCKIFIFYFAPFDLSFPLHWKM